jgi:hypothetical protein
MLGWIFYWNNLSVREDMCVELKVLHSWEEMRNACKVLVIKLEGKGPL